MTVIEKQRTSEHVDQYLFRAPLSLYNLPQAVLDRLLSEAKLLTLKRKSTLFQEGEPPKGVYAIKRGKIKSSQLNYDGSVQILYIHRDGEFIGHRTIFGNEKQPITMTALEDCEIYFIEKDAFLKIISETPQLTVLIMKSMSQEFTTLVNRINVFAQKGIKERLALFLLVLNETFKKNDLLEDSSEIHMNRNDLAAYTGTSVENLVRTLKTFKEAGYVRVEGKSIFIENFEALNNICGGN